MSLINCIEQVAAKAAIMRACVYFVEQEILPYVEAHPEPGMLIVSPPFFNDPTFGHLSRDYLRDLLFDCTFTVEDYHHSGGQLLIRW